LLNTIDPHDPHDSNDPCCPYNDQSNYLFRPNDKRTEKGKGSKGPTPNLKYRAVHLSWHAPSDNTPKLCLVAARDIEKEEVLVAPLLPLVWPWVQPVVDVVTSVSSNKRRRGCSTTKTGGSSSGGLMVVGSEDEDSSEESSNDSHRSWKRRKM
jgi:hypothetical protein